MSWVTTWRVPPPRNKTISVRFGGSVCFAYHHALLDKWFMITPPTEEEIAAPNLWWCKDNLSGSKEAGLTKGSTAETMSLPAHNLQTRMRRSSKPQQLKLFS